jgi:hypothetical protein
MVTDRYLLLIVVLALILYLPGVWWGIPHATGPDRVHSWGVDDETPLGPLAEVHNIIQPKPDRNLGYPLMYSFLVAAAYSPYLLYLWWTQKLTTFSATYPYGLLDPIGTLKVLGVIAHSVSLLMGVGIIGAAYDIGRTMWDRRVGVLAALFVLTLFPMFYYTRTGNVDVPVLFFIALATAAYARILIYGLTVWRAVWLGIFVGFALGTKESAAGAFLAMPLVLLLLHRQDVKKVGGGWSWAFWKAPLAGLLATVLALGVGSGLFVDPERYVAHIKYLSKRVEDLSTGDHPVAFTYPYTLEGNLQYARRMGHYLIDIMTLPGLVWATLSILWLLWREPGATLLALPACTYLIFMFLSARSAQMRYLLPMGFLLAFFPARTVVHSWNSRSPVTRLILTLLAGGILLVGLLRGIELTYEMIYDSRYAAAAWLEPRIEPGDLIEYFGSSQKNPPLKPGVIMKTAIGYYGMDVRPRVDEKAVQEVLQEWKEKRPKFLIIMPDHTSPPGVPYSNTCPPQIYEGLLKGTMGYRLVAYFQTPPLFPWIQRPALDYPTVNPPIRIFLREDTDHTIRLNPAVTYQTITGWEVTTIKSVFFTPNSLMHKYKNLVYDLAINELGINRVRLEITSGLENPVDYGAQHVAGRMSYKDWAKVRYQVINDNEDPFVINPNGFHFTELDARVDNMVLPLKQRLEDRGEKLYINLTYVDFGPSKFKHKDFPEEYAEFILATFLHLQDKYGWVPDAVEVTLEPENAHWSGKQIGQAMVAAGNRLKAYGFHPKFIAPSNTNMAKAIIWFDEMMRVPGVQSYLSEFSYHRYGGVSDTNLYTIASRAEQYKINTAMLEHIGSGYEDLHKDLKIGRNSAWGQYTLAGPGEDAGGRYFWVDESNPDRPIVNMGSRARFLRQYFKYIRSGAVRIQATTYSNIFDPLAFINTDGKYVVVVKATAGGSFSIQGLPAGTYGIKYTTSNQYDVDWPDTTLTEGQTVQASIPEPGVITVYAK